MCNSCSTSSRNHQYLIENRSNFDEPFPDCNDEVCSIVLGYYCFYGTEARSMECEEWAELCDFRKVLRGLKYTNFSVQSSRDAALSSLSTMKVDAPFAYQTRFPLDLLFVNITCGAYSDVIRQVAEALNFKEREKEVQSRMNPMKTDPENSGSRSFSFDDALHSFHKGVEQLNRFLCRREEVYSRETFEKKYGIKWVGGKPRPPTVIDPCDPNTPRPKPDPKPPNSFGTYGALVKAIRTKDLNPDDFLIFKNQSFNVRPKCNQETTKFSAPSDSGTRLFPKTIYVFTQSEYMKCSEGPVKAWSYDTSTGKLTETEFEVNDLDSDSDFASAFSTVSHSRNKSKSKCH